MKTKFQKFLAALKQEGQETKEAVGDTSYTSKGGKVTQTATGLKHQAGSGSYGDVGSGWYPGNDWKGDVARMILYMNFDVH